MYIEWSIIQIFSLLFEWWSEYRTAYWAAVSYCKVRYLNVWYSDPHFTGIHLFTENYPSTVQLNVKRFLGLYIEGWVDISLSCNIFTIVRWFQGSPPLVINGVFLLIFPNLNCFFFKSWFSPKIILKIYSPNYYFTSNF